MRQFNGIMRRHRWHTASPLSGGSGRSRQDAVQDRNQLGIRHRAPQEAADIAQNFTGAFRAIPPSPRCSRYARLPVVPTIISGSARLDTGLPLVCDNLHMTGQIRPPAAKPSLAAKTLPMQQRSAETYEHILEVTAQILEDVGIERLSTNMVCELAGLTPPALYRYFPNKYALLCELGKRLTQRQNELIPRWITPEVLAGTTADLEQALAGLMLDTYRVTKRTPGGVWILRALRAVPVLRTVRLDSHTQMTEAQGRLLIKAFPGVPRKELMLVGRIAVDMIYAGVEMLFDAPLKPRSVAHTIAAMIASHLSRLRKGQA